MYVTRLQVYVHLGLLLGGSGALLLMLSGQGGRLGERRLIRGGGARDEGEWPWAVLLLRRRRGPRRLRGRKGVRG